MNNSKKKIEIDIIHIDEKIKKNILKETNRFEEYKKELEILRENNKNTTEKKKKEINPRIDFLKQKIFEIENNIIMSEYICLSGPIIAKYKKLINTPVKLSFFNGSSSSILKNRQNRNSILSENLNSSQICFSKDKTNTPNITNENTSYFQKYLKSDDEKEKQDIIDEFLAIAKNYIPINTYKEETSQQYYCDCGNVNNCIELQNKIICNECSSVHSIQSIQTSFKDIDRVNLSQKYKYKKKVHFRDTLNQYQGKQNKNVEHIYPILEEQFILHNLLNKEGKTKYEKYSSITKEHIYMFLFETNNSNYYEDINMIHTYFTGIPCPDISDIEHLLYEDFDKVVDAYESLEDIDRIHFLNGQYILYQLLKRRKYKVKENDFDILKTRERLVEHDEIYQKICMKLEWTFTPTV
jgi:hypothetical protein